ncbi:MAG: hypothetical protein HQK93_05720 [Nitrospirae bacterium]|nr:hypothetical protein [Nitrospirota bacterium]
MVKKIDKLEAKLSFQMKLQLAVILCAIVVMNHETINLVTILFGIIK